MAVWIIFPDYADDLFWFEHEAKGWVVLSVTDGESVRELEFYEPARLHQTIEEEAAVNGYSYLRGVVVVPAVTRARVEEAVRLAGAQLLS